MTQRVLADSNVLASRTLLGWLYHCRRVTSGMYQLYTTEDVKAEVVRVVRRRNQRVDGGVITDKLNELSLVMDEVLQDFPGTLPFTGADEGDYHIHAAAVAGRADLVVTSNDPRDITADPDGEHYEILTPDAFLVLVSDSSPTSFLEAVRRQLAHSRKNPEGYQIDDALRRAGCPETAARVREALMHLARSPRP